MPFDDDDTPLFAGPAPATRDNEDEGGRGGGGGVAAAEEAMMEDDIDMPDYKLFAAMFEKKGVSSKAIRKGEKDFEEHGTQAQEGTLEASRRALEDVLSYTRIHKPDSWTRGWLLPNFWDDDDSGGGGDGEDAKPASSSASSSTSTSAAAAAAAAPAATPDPGLRLRDRVVVVEHERGGWMRDIGRVVPGGKDRLGVGRLWLLPEEALYLVERGTLDLWWPSLEFEELIPPAGAGAAATAAAAATPNATGNATHGAGAGAGAGAARQGFGPDDYAAGTPLSLEAAYSLLIGFEGERGKTTLPRYQVYAHLKRAGFNILRAPPPAPETETGPQRDEAGGMTLSWGTSLWRWLFSYVGLGDKQQQQQQQQAPHARPCGPLVAPGLYRAYRPIYQQLAILPRHKPLPAPGGHHHHHHQEQQQQDPFKVHFHVWKPAGGFSKRSPPQPDFRIAVADTSDSFVPTLEQVTALLASTPHDPAPEAWQGPGRLYQRLKHGHRNVLVAVVDRGLVNYMRFGEGAFGEEELFGRFDVRGGGRGGRGGKKGGRGRGRGGRGRGRGGRGG
ncbi:putative tRNA-splicing endonuclease subunit tsp-5 [Escovopsis weberi]|uniref:Putative tRNA-splicing endonuclease subunit tsp-5 n=1 Tax=Escovopsis weberi TaxID=150374 RepID=A0A0M8N8C8_ESCWE|nr:putative tRNA-splicing endonuclease subunit tsp-5 [Escovopsis weberi]